MKNTQTSTFSEQKFTFNILNSLRAEVEVRQNPYALPIEELFTMAARINKKRSFLFVSKLLGKHLPIDPNKGLLTSALLAARYYELVNGVAPEIISNLKSTFLFGSPEFSSTRFIDGSLNPIIIGFAETATALGHAFFDCFQNGDYFHTTREDLINRAPAHYIRRGTLPRYVTPLLYTFGNASKPKRNHSG
ncbi:phosphoribosyltransferase domain-containing protein [Neobacillus sp. PS3-34]|uniref:phosphoribosyltransferase domain-containing protein n=1 Tax=Neobacillus sp. PS3-34 TaxID=3070678 RepID=UPI0027E17C8D|nr:phosphoribosyltransferase domain-containing protein [Neobacillus sp. PS3-34]WML47779.1 phosphoribosyltransferase domain-containing protein [Neobacillus sp. PS3-34]